jgi:hypothetical protein
MTQPTVRDLARDDEQVPGDDREAERAAHWLRVALTCSNIQRRLESEAATPSDETAAA